MTTKEIVVIIGNEEVDVEIEYTQEPIVRARLFALPEDCYPESGGEIEIQSLYLLGGPEPVCISNLIPVLYNSIMEDWED